MAIMQTIKADRANRSPGAMGGKTGDPVTKPSPRPQTDRRKRREKQKKELEDFKSQLKVVPKTGGTLYQEEAPTFNPMTGKYERTTLADKRIQLANKYGPTFREILGDVGSGLRSMSGGLGDFIARGGVTGSVLSNIYNKFKSGAKTGIETVGGLYDNLRNAFKGESQFSPPQAQGGIYQGQPIEAFVPPTFDNQKIQTERLPSMEIDSQFPYNFETVIKPRPLTNEILPTELKDDDFRNTYPFLYNSRMQDLPFKAKPNVSDQNQFQTALADARVDNVGINLLGKLQNLQNLAQQYNLDNVQFDPFKGQIGFQNQFMINDTPVNYNFGVGDRGLQGGIEFAFKDGGSVNKHSGLGYMFK